MTIMAKDEQSPEELNNCLERLFPESAANETLVQEHIGRYVFASRFVKDKAVLDIASGVGYGSYYLCEQGAALVIGADISFDAIAHAKNRGPLEGLHFVAADATKMPFEDCAFELLVSFETIEHIEQYKTFLSECGRVLKTNGLFLCSTPNKAMSVALGIHNPYHAKEFYPAEFRELTNEYFSEVHCFGQRKTNVSELKAAVLKQKVKRRRRQIPRDLLRHILGDNFGRALWSVLGRGYHRLKTFQKNISGENVDVRRLINDGNFTDALLDDFKVTTFEDNWPLATPAFVILLCRKPKKKCY